MLDIITIGSAVRDVFVFSKALHAHEARDTVTHIEACLPFGAKINVQKLIFDTGGGATNNAATFKRLGKFRVGALTRLGRDLQGHLIMGTLKQEKIKTSFIQISDKDQTSYSTILSSGDSTGERTILNYRGASRKIEASAIKWRKFKARWFYISSLGGDLELLKLLLNHAKKIKAKVVLNPGSQELKQHKKLLPLLKQVDFLILNREEAAKLAKTPYNNTKKLLHTLSKISSGCLMTDGPKGAYAVLDKKAYHIPSGGSKPKNLTGAGDAFGSGFVTGWIKSKGDIKESLRVGTLNANSVVQKIGAKNGILEQYPNRKIKIKQIKL